MTTFKANRKFPNPITVTDEPRSHTLALQQIIEALNVGQRRTREIGSSYVRVSELVDVGLIEIVGNQLKLTNLGSTVVSGGATTLAALTDVDLTGLADGDTLVYDSGVATWLPSPAAGAAWSMYPDMVPPVAADFPTWVNQGTASATDKVGRLVLTAPNSGTLQLRAIVKSVPATPYSVTAAFQHPSVSTGVSAGCLTGLVLRQSSNGKLIVFDLRTDSTATKTLRVLQWDDPNTPNSNLNAPPNVLLDPALTWLRITDDGTTRKYWFSLNGKDWNEFASHGHTAFITPDQVGLAIYNDSAGFAVKYPVYHYAEAASVLGDES